MRARSPTITGPSTLAPVPIFTSLPIVGPLCTLSTSPIVTQGAQRDTGLDLGDPVDHDLTVGDEDAGMDQHREPDAHLAGRHRQVVRESGHDRDARHVCARACTRYSANAPKASDTHMSRIACTIPSSRDRNFATHPACRASLASSIHT